MVRNSRSIAADLLCRVIEDGQSLTAALEQARLDLLASRDRAFVQALCYGVMRWYFRLDFLLGRLLHKPLKDADVRVLALLGLYQIAYTRVKPHAAVAETVAALRDKPWAKSLLNAVLRNYLRERERLDALADNSDVAASAHPRWLLDALRADWPAQAETIIAANNDQPPMVLRLNRKRCDREKYLALLAEGGIAAAASPLCACALTLDLPVDVAVLPGFAEGWVSVQDTAAQLAASLLDVKAGHRVLDVCAAPGGKTMHILETCPDLRALIAVDIDGERLTRVRQNLARGGLSAELIAGDACEPSSWWDGTAFDRILLDAPCSATGVIRRHPDIKLLRRREDIDALCRTQQKMLEAVWPLLTPGGMLLYATCSILRRENHDQVSAFLRSHDDAFDMPIEAEWGIAEGVGRQILTGEGGMDGFYYARIGRKGGDLA